MLGVVPDPHLQRTLPSGVDLVISLENHVLLPSL